MTEVNQYPSELVRMSLLQPLAKTCGNYAPPPAANSTRPPISGPLRVLILREGIDWVAQVLEYDISGRSQNRDRLVEWIHEDVDEEFVQQEEDEDFAKPAPPLFFSLWNKAHVPADGAVTKTDGGSVLHWREVLYDH
jgi:hypothetical protein